MVGGRWCHVLGCTCVNDWANKDATVAAEHALAVVTGRDDDYLRYDTVLASG